MKELQKIEEIKEMERVWLIYTHPEYQECLQKNREEEKTRIFCKHDIQHFLDVARLAYIFNLERNYKLSKDLIYAAAFLHDIGKWQQYRSGIPHERASAEIAEIILMESGFDAEERKQIIYGILMHRTANVEEKFAEIIYDADKISRSCYMCEAEKECNWSTKKKNLKVTW